MLKYSNRAVSYTQSSLAILMALIKGACSSYIAGNRVA